MILLTCLTMNEVRIDKWMWATRIFKTRTIASDACKRNRVSVGGVNVKPSRMIKTGDIISVRKPPITYAFRVLEVTEKRMGAKLVPHYLENITPPEQYEILEMNKISGFVDRAKGLGRPTKKDRRELEQFAGAEYGTSGNMACDFDWDETWLNEPEESEED
jgi:ribosome-associated heat shock protein Hsp15